MIISTGEIMCLDNVADQSDKVPAQNGIEAWKHYRYNHYCGYNHVPNITLSFDELSASQLMTISRDGALQLFNVQPAKRFNELISQKYLEESQQQVI